MRERGRTAQTAERREGVEAEGRGAKEVQDLKEDLAIKRAKHRRQLAEFNEHTTSECHKIEADTKEQANSLALEKARVLDTLRLSAQEEAALAEAQAEAEVQRFRAKTEATVAHNRAEAATTVAQAEKNANAALKKKRELDIDEKRLDVYQALASNKQVVVTDATDAESARLLASDAVLQQHGGQQSSEAALVAKMNVLRVASNALGMRSEWDQSKLDGIKSRRRWGDRFLPFKSLSVPFFLRPLRCVVYGLFGPGTSLRCQCDKSSPTTEV